MDPEGIVDLLERSGHRGVFFPYRRVEEANEIIRAFFRDGMLDKQLYNEYMPTYVDAKPPRTMPSPKSVFIFATSASQRKVTFHLGGQAFDFVVPPTYGTGAKIDRTLRNILRNAKGLSSLKMVNAYPPLKLLAVRSGLAMYGRNNIAYVPEFGSFHRLSAFYSNLEVPDDNWGKMRTLPKCAKCGACISACPTKAICDDRFLIRAERCISYMNEQTSDHAFPSWVRPEWHNAIVGCMICQRVCPYDRDFIGKFERGPSFSEVETEYLLKGKFSGKKAAVMATKLKKAGLDTSVFPRNLKMLLDRARSK